MCLKTYWALLNTMRKYLIYIVLISGCFSAYPQDCNFDLSGKVTDIHDGSLLPNAVIQIKSLGIGTVSDLDGRYELEGICEGIYEVEISHPECKTITRNITIDQNTTRNFKLEHHLEELNEILLLGEIFDKSSVPEKSLGRDIIEQYSNASLGDALKEISGVSSLNTGSTVVKPVIHGLHSSRVLIMNHGVRMEDQQWGVEHAPNIDINTAGSLKVIKGAAALQYGGDAIGGVIRVLPQRPPVKDTLMGRAIISAASNGRGTSLTSNLLKSYESGLYWKTQGTLKYMGELHAPDYILSNTAAREKDFSVGFGLNKIDYGFDAFYSYFNTDIGILRASHLGNITDLVRAINNGDPRVVDDFTYDIGAPRQDVQHHLAKINFFRRFSNAGELKLQYSFQLNQRKEFDIRRGNARNRASLDLALKTHNLKTSFNWEQYEDFEATFGVDISFQNNFANPATGVRRLIPDYDMFSAGAFILGSYFLNDDFTIDAGVRYDYNHIDAQKFYLKSRWEERNYDENYSDLIIEDFGSQWLTNPVFDYHNLSASLGGNYQWNHNLSLVMNLSTASRMPNPSELFSDGLHHSAATIELGDLSLQQEKSYKASLGIEGRFDKVDFSVNPYVNYITDFVVLEPSGIEQTIRGAFPVHEYRQINAHLFGIDINVDYQLSEMFNYSTGFAYVNGQDIENNRPIIDMAAPNWSNKIQYYNEGLRDLKISLSNDLVFEQTRFPDNDFTANVPVNGELVPTLVEISQPPEAYNLLHFGSEITVPLNNRSDLGIGFSINNILNTRYRDYLNRQRYYADDLGRNFLIQFKFNY